MVDSFTPICRKDVSFIILVKFGRLTLSMAYEVRNQIWHLSEADVISYFKFILNRLLLLAETVSKQLNGSK